MKGIESAILFEGELLVNHSEFMTDVLFWLWVERMKKKNAPEIKENKSIIFLLGNIIIGGIELKEEKPVLRIGTELEKEGKNVMIKEEISTKEWKELSGTALSLELYIFD